MSAKSDFAPRVEGLVWISKSTLQPFHIGNIRDSLTVHPKPGYNPSSGLPVPTPPIPLYEETAEEIGVPWSFYNRNRRKDTEPDLSAVSVGLPMRPGIQFTGDVGSTPRFVEQTAMVEKLVKGFQERPFWGQIIQAACGVGKCVHPETLISTDKGMFEAGELVPEGLDDQSIPCDDLMVEARDGLRSVSALYGKISAPTLKIRTVRGFSVGGSVVHPVRVLRDGILSWIKLSEVVPGDFLLMKEFEIHGDPVPTGHLGFGFGPTLDPKDARMMGILVGDGYVRARSTFKLSTQDPEILDEFRSWSMRHLGSDRVKFCSGVDYAVHSVTLRDAFESLGLGKLLSVQKVVPWSVLRSGRASIAAFLSGYFDTDGGVEAHGLSVTSGSYRLLEQTQILLLGLGIRSSLKVKNGRYKGERVSHWRLTIHMEHIERFRDEIGFRVAHKRDALAALIGTYSTGPRRRVGWVVPVKAAMARVAKNGCSKKRGLFSNYAREKSPHQPSRHKLLEFIEAYDLHGDEFWNEVSRPDVFFDEVKYVEEGSPGRVVDLTVPDGSNYVANGVVVHNTSIGLRVGLGLGVKTLIVVHKELLLEQWVKRVEQYFKGAKVGIIQQSRADYDGFDFSVALIQSLVSRRYSDELYKAFGLVEFDETHRVGAQTFSQVPKLFSARYRLGLTATPRRKDGAEDVFFEHIGPITVVAKAKAQDFTVSKMPATLGVQTDNRLLIDAAMVTNPSNSAVVGSIAKAVTLGRKILVVGSRLDHLWEIGELIKVTIPDATVGWSTGSRFVLNEHGHRVMEPKKKGKKAGWKRKTSTKEQLAEAERAQIILATRQMIEEGWDVQSIDAIYLVTPMPDPEQVVGRGRRECLPEPSKCETLCWWRAGVCHGKPKLILKDVVYTDIPSLVRSWKKRLQFYAAEGAKVVG